MRMLIKRIAYLKFITNIMNNLFGLFYDKNYLCGKFFEKHRIGYFWCLKSIPRIISLRGQKVYFPCGKYTEILDGSKIKCDPSSLNVFQQSGCYFQAFANITIGKDVWIAKNVGVITANHKLDNLEEHDEGKAVIIGDKCWIGMNSVILPGVCLGERTIVGAGSVVTKSFEGHCVIAGNPAKIIRVVND